MTAQISPRLRSLRVAAWDSRAVGLVLFGLALIPRVIATATFLVPDEPSGWFLFSQNFLAAVSRGDFAGTVFVGHPGVTTMWLGALGHLLYKLLLDWGWATPADFAMNVHALRLPIAVANAACVGIAYPPLRRLVDAPVALLALLFWAADPFAVALSQVLHVDALLTSLMLLALLFALVALRFDDLDGTRASPIHWPSLLASAVAAGLAMLTKSPGGLLLPIFGLIALTSMWRHQPTLPWQRRLWRAATAAVLPTLAWAAAAALVWVAGWPLAWVDPAEALRRVVGEVVNNGAQPHENGNFFFGRSVDDPGPLFYPVVIAFRLTPWVLIGCVFGAGALARAAMPAQRRATMLLLIAAALAFVLMITLLAKKFDRYALPVFPILDLLAALGYVTLASWLARRLGRSPQIAVTLTSVALAIMSALNLALYHPYEMTYFNSLLGGGPAAQATIPVSWGEGYDLAAAFIMRQPDACERPVAVWIPAMLGPYSCPKIQRLHAVIEHFDQLGYVMLYTDVIQRGKQAPVVEKMASMHPIYTVRIHGVDLAFVYQFPKHMGRVVSADFGGVAQLYSYNLDASHLRDRGELTLRTQWQASGSISTDYSLFIHVLDANGRMLTQIDVPPAGPEAPTSTWHPWMYIQRSQSISVPADLPSGRYWVAIGLYDPQTSIRLTLGGVQPQPGAPTDGNDALILGPVDLP